MTDSILIGGNVPTTPAAPTTAGGLLRQARQAQGLHIAALAAAIKVTPSKLEALESEQFDRLPDATFTRALAQAVCRSLKIDPAPVLALLPPPNGHRLEEVAEGLKTPFNERPGRLVPGQWLKLSGATLWIAAVLMIGALVLYVMPVGWVTIPHNGPTSPASGAESSVTVEPVVPGAEPDAATPKSSMVEEAPTAVGGAASGATLVAATPSAPVVPAERPAALPAVTAASGAALQFTTTEPAWIGVTDAGGKSLLGRLVQPGETVDLDGAMPLTLRVGHADSVQLKFRGEVFDLKKYTRNDFARLQLK